MANRVASLKAEASLDASKYAAGASQVDAANKKMQGSQAGVSASMTQTQARATESARSFDKYRQSLDPVYKAQQQIEAGERRMAVALEKGQITAAQHAQLMGSLQQRYANVGSEAVRLQTSVGGLYGVLGNLRGVLAGVGGLMAAREYVQYADTMTNVASKLKLVTHSTQELAEVQANLFKLSNDTRAGLEETVTLYARVARNAEQLGLSQQKVLQLTESVNKAIRISGASSAEASSSVIQFSQALSSGVFAGDEFKSLGENASRLARAIADGLGLTVGQLRALSKEGKLTADLAIKGLLSQKDVLEAEFGQMSITVGEAFTVFNNKMLDFVGRVDKATGTSTGLTSAIDSIGTALTDEKLVTGVATIIKGFGEMAKAVRQTFAELTRLYNLLPKMPEIPGFASVRESGLDALGWLKGQAKQAMNLPSQLLEMIAGKPSLSLKTFKTLSTNAPTSVSGGGAANDNSGAGGAGGGSGGGGGSGDSDKDAARRAAALKDYLKDLNTAVKLENLSTLERKKQEAILRAEDILGRNINAATRDQIAQAVELKEIAEKRAQAEQDRIRAEQDAMDEARRKAEEFQADVTTGLSDAFQRIFSGGKDGFRSLIDDWKQRFFRFLADMASKALVEPILMPVIQSVTGGGLGANFGGSGSGVGGISSIGSALGSLGKSIDQFGRDIGIQKGGASGPFAEGTGVFGSNTNLSDIAGGAASGIGIGSTVGALTGGNAQNSAIGGAIGGAIGSIWGPVGSMIGSAAGGFLGGLFGPEPSNQGASARIREDGSVVYGGTKATSETTGAVKNAVEQLQAATKALEAEGITFTDRVTSLQIGVRDRSQYELANGGLGRSRTVGDPNELASFVVQKLLKSATYDNADVEMIAKRKYSSLQDLAKAVDFVSNVYTTIVEAKPGLTAVEQSMKDLTDNFASARKEADRLGLSLTRFDAGARDTFDLSISNQIKSIIDPVGLALEEFERGATARVDTARKLGADLVQVEKLNGLERAQVLAQVQKQSFDGLRSLIDDIAFGGLSAQAPDQQYFSALTRYNQSRRDALDSRAPASVAEFETSARALLPIARSFLGTSTQYADLQANIVATARDLGGSASDPAAIGAAIVQATSSGSAAIVDQLQALQAQIDSLIAENKRLNATMSAIVSKAA